MKTKAFGSNVRKVVVPKGHYILTTLVNEEQYDKRFKKYEKREELVCTGVYAHIASFQQAQRPYLNKSFGLFDVHTMLIDGRLRRI